MNRRGVMVMFVVTAIVVGLALGVWIRQWTTRSEDDDAIAIKMRQAEVSLASEKSRYELLRARNEQLLARRNALHRELDQRPDIAETMNELRRNAMLAGMTEVKGPGVILTLNDRIDYDPLQHPIESVIHDSTINYVLNVMWSAGARAMALNDVRLTAVTQLSCIGPTIRCYGEHQMPPYVLTAIGPVETLQKVIEQDPYLSHLTQEKIGIRMSLEVKEEIRLPSFAETGNFRDYITYLQTP